MSVSWWVWAALMLAIAAMLAIDLFLHRDNHVIGFREGALWSGVWIAAGLLFGVILWVWQGGDVAGTYYAGYLIEKALSIDNVFVFALIFTHFTVPAALQHKVLFWGVLGALAFRLAFIFLGAELLETFFWTAYLLGAFLIYTGYTMAFRHGEQTPPDRNPVVRLVRRVIPTDANYHGDAFFTRIDGKRAATLLFVVLIAVEATDLIFALDSVAAILAITTSTFIVWTANAFAILGLRSLYFCLAGLLRRFVHLHYGLAVLLAFAGVKLILSETPVGKLPIPVTLGVIVVTITVSILWSLRTTRATHDTNGPDGPDSPAHGDRPRSTKQRSRCRDLPPAGRTTDRTADGQSPPAVSSGHASADRHE
ncbi:TerC family protein [Streptosporangium sp. NPDC023615]|uniref:TerC family protein n=1 Tax=Streptosporangium sp. NPDC023615 TaxID=3154794 RepID=UPI003431E3FB